MQELRDAKPLASPGMDCAASATDETANYRTY